MEGYSMYFPCYTIGHGVYEKIGKVCRDYGTSAVIIGGHKALAAAQEKVEKACRDSDIKVTGVLRVSQAFEAGCCACFVRGNNPV